VGGWFISKLSSWIVRREVLFDHGFASFRDTLG
jgi:hypothetical protein